MHVVLPRVNREPVSQIVGGFKTPAEHLLSQSWPQVSKVAPITASLREGVARGQQFPSKAKLKSKE